MNPLVSVVVPIYNVERYLDRCIVSIVDQTYKNLEIILVDDGSPDRCPAMCDAWAQKDARVKVIHKKNQGVGVARNSGIAIATGKYIFFIDSDDYLELNAVERCVDTAESTGVQSVIFGRKKAYADGTIKEDSKNIKDCFFTGKAIIKKLIPSFFDYALGVGVSACSKMFSLDIIKKYGLTFEVERSFLAEDAMFNLGFFAKASNVAVISDRLYYYFSNDSSRTTSYQDDRQLKNNQFLIKCIEKASELEMPHDVLTHAKARYHGMTLGTLMQIVQSDLTRQRKKAKLREIYSDPVLRETLTKAVIRLDDPIPRVFWFCLKLRLYWLCDLLLICNRYR